MNQFTELQATSRKGRRTHEDTARRLPAANWLPGPFLWLPPDGESPRNQAVPVGKSGSVFEVTDRLQDALNKKSHGLE
jgi:hypothetical protein